MLNSAESIKNDLCKNEKVPLLAQKRRINKKEINNKKNFAKKSSKFAINQRSTEEERNMMKKI